MKSKKKNPNTFPEHRGFDPVEYKKIILRGRRRARKNRKEWGGL